MSNKELYNLGWQAAASGDSRSWAEKYGAEAVRGYDAYWEWVEC